MGEALRQYAQRFVQGPGDDGAGIAGETDDFRRGADQGGSVRFDRRHVGSAGDVLRSGGNSIHRAAATRENFGRATDTADLERVAGALSRYGFRRLHEVGPADHERSHDLPGELDELPADRRSKNRWYQ